MDLQETHGVWGEIYLDEQKQLSLTRFVLDSAVFSTDSEATYHLSPLKAEMRIGSNHTPPQYSFIL